MALVNTMTLIAPYIISYKVNFLQRFFISLLDIISPKVESIPTEKDWTIDLIPLTTK